MAKEYSKKYMNLINGRYVAEGLRITAGVVLPSFLLGYFDLVHVGLVISLGALCVSTADTPGASRHRFNGMSACSLMVTVIAVVVQYATVSPFFLGALILISGFLFSMLAVYGNRSSAVGIAVLLVLILSLQTPLTGTGIWLNAAYIFAGGVWYMLYSLLLYRLRPYKFIQQVVADYILQVSAYLKLRGDLYAARPDYDKISQQLLQQQVTIEAEQNMLSDLLFNTRTIVKETTRTGRVLVKTFLDVVELYGSIMTTYQQYPLLHQQFDATGILQEYQQVIYALSQEMEAVSAALRTGLASEPGKGTKELVKKARGHFESLRQYYMTDENVENFVSLGRIQNNLEELSDQITQLHLYTTYDVQVEFTQATTRDALNFVPEADLRPSLFFNNLHLESNIFRHSIRVALALLAGYIVSLSFKADYGYWIMLTILVILKPAYSLTKKRNSDRLIGTAAGIAIGLLVLFLVKDVTPLLAIMLVFMAASYMFIRTNYFLTVMLMTTYLVIFFHYLFPGDIEKIMLERFVDTVIGSGIAFFASLFIIPAWERHSIKTYMVSMLDANDRYYTEVALHIAEVASINTEKINSARREVLIALANLSDAFTRMMTEPKRFRQGLKNVDGFVSVSHTLVSHITSLSYLLQTGLNGYRSPDVIPVVENTKLFFKNTITELTLAHSELPKPNGNPLKLMNEKVQQLLEARKLEIAGGALETATKKQLVETKSVTDQLNFIYSNAAAIYKISKTHDAEMANAK